MHKYFCSAKWPLELKIEKIFCKTSPEPLFQIQNLTHMFPIMYSKTCLKRPLKTRQNKGLKTDGTLMQVESNAEILNLLMHSAILLTCIKL